MMMMMMRRTCIISCDLSLNFVEKTLVSNMGINVGLVFGTLQEGEEICSSIESYSSVDSDNKDLVQGNSTHKCSHESVTSRHLNRPTAFDTIDHSIISQRLKSG